MSFFDDKAYTINDLIAAVEAIETELGIVPSGVYANVRARLDIVESRINNPNAPAPDVLNPFFIGNTGVTIQAGFGDPNIVVAVNPQNASLFLREDGYSNQGLYQFADGYWYLVNATLVPGGDLSGNNLSQTVIGIQGRPVSATAPTTGQVLEWSGSNWAPSTFTTTLAGDVTGPLGSNTVSKIQGNTVTSGALVTGDLFIATTTSNWASTTVTGDVSFSAITPGFTTVTALQGFSVATTAPTSGQVLEYNTGTSKWTPTNLPGGSSVTGSGFWHSTSGLLDAAASHGTAGQFSLTNSGGTDIAWTTISGDISASVSTVGQLTVTSISGATPITISPNEFQWISSATPLIDQAVVAGTGANAGVTFTIKAQAGQQQSGSNANNAGGNITIASGVAGTGGSGASAYDGYVYFESGSTVEAFVSSTLATASGFGIGTTPGVDPTITRGTGVPATTQPNGSVFLRTDGSSSTGVYTRQSGAWAALGGGSTGHTIHSTITATTYAVVTADDFIPFDSTSNIITLTLPATPVSGETHIFADITGAAVTNNVTVDGNGKNIVGASTFVISSAYNSITVVYNGTNWSII